MKRFSLVFVVAAFLSLGLQAQGVLNVRINEVLVVNENDIVDDYGNHSSWIELFNTSHERVDLGGCFLGVRYANSYDASGNKLIKKYSIPRHSPVTEMGALSYQLYFCEGTDTKGPFYTNFTLTDEPVDMIILYNADGKEVISVFEFPADYAAEADVTLGIAAHEEPQSYLMPYFSRKDKKQWKKQGLAFEGDFMLDQISARQKYAPEVLEKATPGNTNEELDDVPRHERFRRKDPKGFVMMLTAMAVVFSALILIFLVIKLFGIIMMRRTRRAEAKSKGVEVEQTTPSDTSGEVIAAIGFALKLFQEDLHDNEATVITISRVGRAYSPWSSKIHTIRQVPEKKNR